ncbi:MAG: ABC transporter substrate-binding protein, partial [Tistlia sp.]
MTFPRVSRRRLLKAGAATLVGAAAVQAPFIGRAQAAANELEIAVINSLSGRMARYGLELKRGIDLAVTAANESGLEIDGAPIEVGIKEYDDKSEAVTAARLVERAIDSDLVIAGVGSVNAKTIIPVAQRLRTPMLSLWAQVDGVFAGQKGAPYVFGPMPPFSLYYTQILEMVSQLDDPSVRTVAMITPRDELGVFTAEQYVPSDVEKAGLELLGTEFFPPNSQDFSSALDRIRRLEPDILIINCYTPDIIAVYKEMQATGYFPPVVIVEAPTNLAESLGSDLEGVFVPGFWDPTLDSPRDPIFGTSR